MLSAYPYLPFQVALTTTAEQRVIILERLAEEGKDYRVVRRLAGVAARAAHDAVRARPVSMERHYAEQALRVAQERPYEAEPPGEEWFQSAWWSAQPGVGGDCDDLAVLFVALCRALGLQAHIVWITQTGQNLNHVCATVLVDGAWLWADPSIRGARLGESPYQAAARLSAWGVVGGEVR